MEEGGEANSGRLLDGHPLPRLDTRGTKPARPFGGEQMKVVPTHPEAGAAIDQGPPRAIAAHSV